jgi:molecular chaperone DnaK (HSP70)
VSEAEYAIGIDLGTTHSALSSVDLSLSEGESVAESQLAVPQLVAPGEVDARPLLPSFLYLPHELELPPDALTLPWKDAPSQLAVGELARNLGAKSAVRMVSSAKSWLCHSGVDRHAAILPAGAPHEVPKVSPVEASMQYLAHLAHAWNHAHPEAQLSEQLVTITVPASFDPAARELTAEAARRAGLPNAVLLEEPQAALYAWLSAQKGGWRKQVELGDLILVVDIGGGTTDFSLIAVREADGTLTLDRIAVGEHILLGGDNMDLALAYVLRTQLEAQGQQLDQGQLVTLTQAARGAKERLFNEPQLDAAPVIIPGRGAKLIGGQLRTELARETLVAVLVDGFFPACPVHARPQTRARAALTQLGLPYAQDAAITRHLAAFLSRQASSVGHEASGFARPSRVLFNGGVLKAPQIAERILQVLDSWLAQCGAPEPKLLPGADLDLAVARGAAYYGYVRRGQGIRIRGGSAMAYYVGVESAMPAVPGMPPPLSALCLAPFGLEEGTHAEPAGVELGLVVGEPVRFRFFGSSMRRDDRPGDLLERFSSEELRELSEIEACLPATHHEAGSVVSVRLQAGITEVGTLELLAVAIDGTGRWKVELDTRAAP